MYGTKRLLPLSRWLLKVFLMEVLCVPFLDGPENIAIAGPAQIQVGQSLEMTCSTASTPPASYKWTLNEIVFSNSSQFSFVVQDASEGGNYSCHAVNSVTGRTLSAVHAVSVTQSRLVLLCDRIFPSGLRLPDHTLRTDSEVIICCTTSHVYRFFSQWVPVRFVLAAASQQ